MGKYLQVSYYTLTGIRKFIDIGDFSYGEWIIYDNKIPKYHIVTFDNEGPSNTLIDELLRSKKESIESLLEKISKSQNKKLSLGNRPFCEFIKKSEHIELDLIPLPYEWVKQIL